MFTHTKLTETEGKWEIKVSYDMPFNGSTKELIIQKADKIEAMKTYFVNAKTLLTIRLDEFHAIVTNEIAPKFQKTSEHYRIKIDSKNWLPKYWRFREEISTIKDLTKKNQKFCDDILLADFVFQMILPEYEILAGYKVQLISIHDEIKKLARAVKASEKKIHEEYRLTF